MSLICLCFTDIYNEDEMRIYQHRLENIAREHGRGVTFSVNWPEPIVEYLKGRYMLINLLDEEGCDNCQKLLAPEEGGYGAYTNNIALKQRMKFLQDIADALLDGKHKAEFYIGLSGTNPDDFLEVVVNQKDLIEYLTSKIGWDGIENEGDFHIIVTP